MIIALTTLAMATHKSIFLEDVFSMLKKDPLNFIIVQKKLSALRQCEIIIILQEEGHELNDGHTKVYKREWEGGKKVNKKRKKKSKRHRPKKSIFHYFELLFHITQSGG